LIPVFDGFVLEYIDVGGAVLRVRHGGHGTPVLLLHSHPRTHVTWHRVAPLLAQSHAVVCPDLRGYGESSKPVVTEGEETYSKRAMAEDCVRLMSTLGHDRFAVAGHDRGSYVAFRLALDHPDEITGSSSWIQSRSWKCSLAAIRASRAPGSAGSSWGRRRSRLSA
jgi:haloacetate dehalogenase